MSLRSNTQVSADQIAQLMTLVDQECRWADEVRVAATGRYFQVAGPAPADVDAIIFETEVHEYRDALSRNDISAVRDQISRYAAKIGVQYNPDSLDERILGRAVLRAYAEASERAASELRHRIPTPALNSCSPLDDGTASPRSPSTTFERSPVVPGQPPARFAGLHVEALWTEFAGDQVASKRWRPAIADQSFGTMRAWIKAVGIAKPAAITSAVAHEFRRIMLRLPGDYAKNKRWRHLSFSEILSAVDGTQYKTLAITTWNRHQSTMSAFWEWLFRNEITGTGSQNPFDDLWIEVDKALESMEGGSVVRPIWSTEKLKELFESPLYVGCESHRRRHIPGDLLIRDALYWGTLIIALTGMRREEVSALKIHHVETDRSTGILFFNLKAGDLRLKNRESRRWVPVPNKLLELGFVEGCLAGRAEDQYLFPELRGRKNFGDKLGKKFLRYRRALKIYEPLLDLHAFRHTVSTHLIRNKVPQAHAEEITGHRSEARRTAFAIYDKGATLKILADALNGLEWPLKQALDAAAFHIPHGDLVDDAAIDMPNPANMEVPT